MTIKKIFSKRIAYELRKRGFKIIGTEPSEYKPQFDAYLFQESEELEKAMGEIINGR